VGKLEGKRPLGRQRHKRVDDIKIHLSMTGWRDMDWNDLTQDRDQLMALLNTVMKPLVPFDVEKLLSKCSCITGVLPRTQFHEAS
jgi:hypothetical protein